MRHVLSTVGAILLVAASAAAAGADQPDQAGRPRVHLIATGGTISNQTGGRLSAAELLDSIPNLDRYVEAESEQFANVASGTLTLTQWLQLSRRVNTLFERNADLAGIVVSMGTDTLEETSYFLHLTVRSDRPVVVVGSMRNPSTLGYEGAANLLEAFRVAADPASRDRGVLVVLNDEINSAREVAKTNSQRVQTFRTRGYGVLGVVDRDRVIYYRDLTRRHTLASEFDASTIDHLPRVDILMVYQDAPGDLIRAAVDAGARGIVIASAGAGATSGTQRDALTYAYRQGVFVVVSTRTGSGRVLPPRPRPSSEHPTETEQLRQRYRIAGQDLTPLKARILLMLALTRTDDADEIRRMFEEY